MYPPTKSTKLDHRHDNDEQRQQVGLGRGVSPKRRAHKGIDKNGINHIGRRLAWPTIGEDVDFAKGLQAVDDVDDHQEKERR